MKESPPYFFGVETAIHQLKMDKPSHQHNEKSVITFSEAYLIKFIINEKIYGILYYSTFT